MKRKAITVLFFTAWFLTAAAGGDVSPQQKQEDRFTPYWHQRAGHFSKLPDTGDEIIFLGDSITDGCNWTEMLADLRVKNRGISGDVTNGVLARLDEVTQSRPQIVFLLIGINDLADGIKPEQIVENIQLIVKKIRLKSPKTRIYLQSLLPVNPDLGMFPSHTKKSEEVLAVNIRLKKLAKKFGLTYVDLYSRFVTVEGKLNPRLTNDGLHLTGEGYVVWKKAVEKYIR